jgi:hypothetical protein
MNLLMVGQLVAQHDGQSQDKISRRKSDPEIASCMFKWIAWGLVVLGLGVLMLVTGKTLLNTKIIDPFVAGWLRLISTYLILGGGAMPIVGVLNALRQSASLSPGRHSTRLTETIDTKQLPTNPIPQALPSVTERTTQLIPVDIASKPETKVN